MKSVNKVILIGNLRKDPEVKYVPKRSAMAKFSLATSELAELAGQYLKKGSKLYVEGHLETRSWDDKQSGQKRYATEVVARDLIFLDSKEAF